ncbi:MAG TPA: LamG domain-containing protein [Thermoanaerobaculia bacterium]|nr:LamG domain-containing protein [Thermoanaerobaculia bacterium]
MRKPILFLCALASVPLSAQDGLTQVTAPRWLDPPKLDGKCGDPAYERGAKLTLKGTGAAAQVSLVHSSLDLFLCLPNLSSGAQRLAVRVDPNLSRGDRLTPGDYVFSFTAAGAVQAEQGNADGKLVPLKLAEGDAAVKTVTTGNTWTAEARISLEWLGGYARTAGFGLTLESSSGFVLQRWPAEAALLSPKSWGELALDPIYPKEAVAGSAFLDGREGYLVVPYAPELNPKEVTIEAWARAVDGDCGTLVGNGQASSYWLALCEGIRFTHGGTAKVQSGPYSLGDGWHHVAVTMDAAGMRTLYVDGIVILQPGWKPPQEKERGEVAVPIRLGASSLPLRIGSDRDAFGRDPLHGYVRDLRIWSQARTVEQIRAAAFAPPAATERGLVARWPFTSDLRDVVGGHHAGLVGNASLAREAPKVTQFPTELGRRAPQVYPKRKALPAWDARVPAAANEKGMQVDGDCTRAEYVTAAKLSLEPDRSLSMRALVAGDALYLCTNILVGRPGGPKSSVTFWIDRDGKATTKPHTSDLRLRLTPDGKLEAGTGKGQGFTGAAPTGIRVKTLRGDRLQAQEDLRKLNAPWWSGEIRIPLAALAPFKLSSPLRLAVAYDGEAPAVSRLPGEIRARWPASFQELRSDTWGAVRTERRAMGVTGTSALALISSALRTPVSSAIVTIPASSPGRAQFEDRCSWFSPSYLYDEENKWPLVNESIPIVQAAGTLTDIHIAAGDSNYIHTSHDVDLAMTLRPADRVVSLSTVNGVAIENSPNVILETESGGFPPNNDLDKGARPSVGDHVTALGRWIFDCGHDPKTEIHPIPMFESDRLEARPIWPGGPMRTVRMVRVWFNSDPEPWGYELAGPFTFDVDLPPTGWSPFLRVVDGDPSRVTFVRTGTQMRISVDPPDRTGTFFWEIMLGHLVQPEDTLSSTTRTATVNSWEVRVLDDHDNLTSGEWFYAVNLNGTWRQLLWNAEVDTGNSVTALERFSVAGPELQLQVAGYEEDPTIPDEGGEPIGIGQFSLGTPDQPTGSSLHSPSGDWDLTFQITPGGDVPASLVEQTFWEPRLDGEPNDSRPISLGTLPVPPPNAPALATRRNGFLTEPGAIGFPPNGETTLFNPEEDRYSFGLADFADVELGTLQAPLVLSVEATSPWHNNLPSTLRVETSPGQTQTRNTRDVIGFSAARLRVASTNGRAGDSQYTVEVRTRFRQVPFDWGESRDTPGLLGGRLIDLVTVPPNPQADPRLRIQAATEFIPEIRTLATDFAWQHIATDTDRYRVVLPPVAGPPPGHTPCQFDSLGRLIITAHPMTISMLNQSRTGIFILPDLRSTMPNGGSILVEVSASAPPRRLYQFEAQWDDSRYFTSTQCDELRRMMTSLRRLTREGELEIMKGLIALQGDRIPGTRPPWPGPDPDPTELPPLGDFRSVLVEKGNLLDLVISSPEGQPVLARLFDEAGVLLGESRGLTEGDAAKTQSPAGLVPHSRLRVEGLKADRPYLLQVVPRDGGKESQRVPLGFGEGERMP